MRSRLLGLVLLGAIGCEMPGVYGGSVETPSIIGPSTDPEHPGALVGRLPVRADGSLGLAGEPGSVVRPVLASLVFWVADEGGRFVVRPFVHLWPVDPPRKPAIVPLEGPQGPVACYGLFDRPTLLQARRASSRFVPQTGNIAGTPGWWILNPIHFEGTGWFGPICGFLVIGEFYLTDPGSGAAPVDVSPVARSRPDGGWDPNHWWLVTRDRAIGAAAVTENGKIVGVSTYDIPEPSLDPCLIGREDFGIAGGRWRNRILIQAKNSTFPKLLGEGKTSDLAALGTRLEQVALDLGHEAELAKDRAQRILGSGQGDPVPDREMSILCHERIELIKSMLSAIRDEISNRKR